MNNQYNSLGNTVASSETKRVFDVSKQVSGSQLAWLWEKTYGIIEEIYTVKGEISNKEFSTTYTQTYYVDKLEREYQDLANKAFFSPAKKLIKLKSTPEYRQKLREAKAADARDTKNAQEKARNELKELRSKLAKLEEEKAYYQPIYNKMMFWAKAAWDELLSDTKELFRGFTMEGICNHIKCLYLDCFSTDTTIDKLLEKAKKEFVAKENRRSFEILMNSTPRIW